MKRAIFHPRADDEFAEAVTFYAGQGEGLGERFNAVIQKLTAEIEAAPQLHAAWRHGTRRHFSRRFPYALIYVERTTHLWVVAVAHLKRHPDYWRRRLG